MSRRQEVKKSRSHGVKVPWIDLILPELVKLSRRQEVRLIRKSRSQELKDLSWIDLILPGLVKMSRSQEVKKSEVMESRSQEVKKSWSHGVMESRSQEVKKSGSY